MSKWVIIAVLLLAIPADAAYRSNKARHDFMRAHPCPATGIASTKPCHGYIIDHIKPLACGGPDEPSNMQWQTAPDAKAKDRWELKGPGCKR